MVGVEGDVDHLLAIAQLVSLSEVPLPDFHGQKLQTNHQTNRQGREIVGKRN